MAQVLFCAQCNEKLLTAKELGNNTTESVLLVKTLESVAWGCSACKLDAHRTDVSVTEGYLEQRLDAMTTITVFDVTVRLGIVKV